MSKKKTQTELLQEIATLLTPVSNLARYQIQQINDAIKAQEAAKAAQQPNSDDKNKDL